MESPLDIVRGTTNTLRLSIKNKGQQGSYILQEGEIIRFGVKEAPIPTKKYLIKKEIDGNFYDDGEYLITLVPDDTSSLEVKKKYWYDIGLQSDENYYMIIECSPFTIIPSVTSIEATEEEEEEDNENE